MTNVVAGRTGFDPHEWSGVAGKAERQPQGSGRSVIVVLLQNGHAHLCLGNPGVRVGCEVWVCSLRRRGRGSAERGCPDPRLRDRGGRVRKALNRAAPS